MNYFNTIVKENDVNKPLIKEITNYVDSILNENISIIHYSSYKSFYKYGSRKEFEYSYFERRKKLTALGLYLQWNNSKKAREYFEELLWVVSNEFSWCLAAHLSYNQDEFPYESKYTLDLFSTETAETLCELLIIHEDKIDKLLSLHIKKQIEDRVITPFLNKTWEFETATHNWSAVCCGCIGIVALLMEQNEKQKQILDRVERALDFYLSGFGSDGISLEGIGYWSYGFGYYIYYKALKKEILSYDSIEDINKIKSISSFPESIQISEKEFLPFSDVPPNTTLPTGLLSYLHDELKINVPLIKQISSFDFDHCYRWAHVSRNLWWTNKSILNKKLKDYLFYFKDAGWIIYRKNNIFFSIKGGSNLEPHNHNDIGSFVIGINGELFLTDLGAGAYTKDYFGDKRYTYPHTRSYYHSVPYINYCEQDETEEKIIINKNNDYESNLNFDLNLSSAYESSGVNSIYRNVTFNEDKKLLNITDTIVSVNKIKLDEGFISYIKPELIKQNKIIWKSNNGQIMIVFNSNYFKYKIEETYVTNHFNESVSVFRLSFINITETNNIIAEFKFYIMY